MPNRGFKYTARKYADSLLVMGGIRIGTLHDFRKQEHKLGIADPDEGRKMVSHHIDDLRIPIYQRSNPNKSKDEAALKAFSFATISEGARNTRFFDCQLSTKFDVPDCFVLCISSRLSRQTMDQFEGADTCIEIIDPSSFINCITETLNAHHRVNYIKHKRCQVYFLP